MGSKGIANPAQLRILSQALEQHCAARHITESGEREAVASFIATLFSRGIGALEDIEAALSESADRELRKQAWPSS